MAVAFDEHRLGGQGLERAFEHIVSRNVLGGEIQFTATPELVAAEHGLTTVTVVDIRRWLEENDERATHAAFIRQLGVGGYASGADRTIRLTIKDMENSRNLVSRHRA